MLVCLELGLLPPLAKFGYAFVDPDTAHRVASGWPPLEDELQIARVCTCVVALWSADAKTDEILAYVYVCSTRGICQTTRWNGIWGRPLKSSSFLRVLVRSSPCTGQ